MTIRNTSADELRAAADAAAADLEALAAAKVASDIAEQRLDDVARAVLARRLVTVEQVAGVLGIGARAVYKRLDQARS